MLTSIETVEDFSLISKDLPCLLRRFLSAVFLAQSKQPFADELRVRDVFPPVDLDAPAGVIMSARPVRSISRDSSSRLPHSSSTQGKPGFLGSISRSTLTSAWAWCHCS